MVPFRRVMNSRPTSITATITLAVLTKIPFAKAYPGISICLLNALQHASHIIAKETVGEENVKTIVTLVKVLFMQSLYGEIGLTMEPAEQLYTMASATPSAKSRLTHPTSAWKTAFSASLEVSRCSGMRVARIVTRSGIIKLPLRLVARNGRRYDEADFRTPALGCLVPWDRASQNHINPGNWFKFTNMAQSTYTKGFTTDSNHTVNIASGWRHMQQRLR